MATKINDMTSASLTDYTSPEFFLDVNFMSDAAGSTRKVNSSELRMSALPSCSWGSYNTLLFDFTSASQTINGSTLYTTQNDSVGMARSITFRYTGTGVGNVTLDTIFLGSYISGAPGGINLSLPTFYANNSASAVTFNLNPQVGGASSVITVDANKFKLGNCLIIADRVIFTAINDQQFDYSALTFTGL